jgi:hypothetical protein
VWRGANLRGRARQAKWDGSAALRGNRFLATKAINFWNPNRPLVSKNDDTVEWISTTTGGFAGFEARLQDADTGTLIVQTPFVNAEVAIKDIGLDDIVFDAGGLERQLRIFRLPENNVYNEVSFRRRLVLREQSDTRLYVCVTQEDGHKAWSSPIYLFRC